MPELWSNTDQCCLIPDRRQPATVIGKGEGRAMGLDAVWVVGEYQSITEPRSGSYRVADTPFQLQETRFYR